MPPRSTPRASATRPRATVTRAFLFSDLRGYTDFVESRGDAAAADLLRAYREIVRKEVSRHSGAEVKTEGDSFYVVFESPSAALECAVHVQRAAHAAGSGIRIGMGLHAGETVPYDDQFVGGAVNVAARLASKAKAGEIVVSDTLRGLVRTGVSYPMADRGPLRLKGVTERVRAWTVDWRTSAVEVEKPSIELPLLTPIVPAPAAPTPGQLTCPVVVGRDTERARFLERVRLAREGRGQVVILAGEAGVGKSAFVRDAIASADDAGFRVLYGATLEADSGLPYAPFVAAIRSGFRGIARDRLGRVLAQAAPDLAQLFPELGKAQRSATTALEQHRLSVAFLGLFTTFARETPVLLVVEDLHWADEASLGLLHYLARELRDQRVLVLATYRSDEMHRRHPVLHALAAMQRERLITEISLGRLDKEQVRLLIDATFRQTDPNIRVSDEFRDAIYERSEGNPFFTEELLKSLVESGDVFYRPETGWDRKPIEQLRIPGSVREAVRERIDRLSTAARDTLSASAVIGLRAPFDLLRTVRGIAESELERHLREAIDQQLVVELGGDQDEYGFRHALTKEVVYDDLLVRERKRLHRAVADILDRDRRVEPALLAHHLVAAGDPPAAVPHLLVAAERAVRAYAPREAARHFEKAIEIGLPEDQLPPVLEQLAETYYLYDFALSRKAAEEAAALYNERGDRLGASRMTRLASRNIWQQGDPERANALARDAIALIEHLGETVELGRAIAHLAQLQMTAQAADDAIASADRALGLGRRFDDAWTVANALITKGSATRGMSLEEAKRLLYEGLHHAIEHGLAETALRGYNNLNVGIVVDRAESERILQEGLAYGQKHGLEQPMLMAQQVTQAWTQGRWDEALALAARVPEGSFWYTNVVLVRGWVTLGREGPDAALAVIRRHAEANAARLEAQRAAFSIVMLAVLNMLRRDEPESARWTDLYLDRTRADRGYAELIASAPPTVAFLSAGLWSGRDEVVDVVEGALPHDSEARLAAELACRSARAIQRGDAEGCARSLVEATELTQRRGFARLPMPVIACARVAERRGLPLGPAWRSPLETARAYCRDANAPWFLAELDRLEALIH
jgi:class 3 adenylate cyclase